MTKKVKGLRTRSQKVHTQTCEGHLLRGVELDGIDCGQTMTRKPVIHHCCVSKCWQTDRHLVIANRILQHMLETHTGCTASRLLLLLYQWNSRLPDPAWPAYLSRHFPVSMLHSRAEWSVRTAGRTGLVHWHLDSNQLLRWRQNTVSFTFLVQDILRFPKRGAGTLRGHVVITGGQVKSRVGKFHWHVNVFLFFF